MFQLDPRLSNDCTVIGNFKLSLLLLMNDANYPWFILVPQEAGIREIYQLSDQQQQQLCRESGQLASALVNAFSGDKINIASLGNIVEQLHIHHVVRYRNDLSWPAPIWGRHKALPYTTKEQRVVTQQLTHALDNHFVPST